MPYSNATTPALETHAQIRAACEQLEQHLGAEATERYRRTLGACLAGRGYSVN